MVEIRKTENFAKWLDRLKISVLVHALWYELNGWQQEILGIVSRLVKVCQNCGLNTDPVIEFIAKSKPAP